MLTQAGAPDLLKPEHSHKMQGCRWERSCDLPFSRHSNHLQGLNGDTYRPSAPQHNLVPVLSWHSPSLLTPVSSVGQPPRAEGTATRSKDTKPLIPCQSPWESLKEAGDRFWLRKASPRCLKYGVNPALHRSHAGDHSDPVF